MAARFDSPGDAFADRNVPLHLLLGLLSLSRRLDGITRVERRPDDAPQGEPEHDVVYLILGLISLQKTLLAAVDPIRAAHRRHLRPPPPSPSPSPLRDLLR